MARPARRARRGVAPASRLVGPVRVLPVLVVVLVVTLCSAASAIAAGADEAPASTGLSGNGVVRTTAPAGPGVAVVAWSPPVDGRVAIVVGNSTSAPVRVMQVVATATDAGGARSVRATTRRVVPQVLPPGAQGLGSVTFRKGSTRTSDTLAFTVRTARVRARDSVPLATGGFVLSPPGTGTPAQTLDLVVTNDTTAPVDGRIPVEVVCLGEAGVPAVAAAGAVARAKLPPGAATHASVGFDLLCPVYVVGAEGRPAR